MGNQVLMGQKSNIIDAISLAVDYCNEDISKSENKKKESHIRVSSVSEKDTLSPKGSVAEVSFSFSTVIRGGKTYWITK